VKKEVAKVGNGVFREKSWRTGDRVLEPNPARWPRLCKNKSPTKAKISASFFCELLAYQNLHIHNGQTWKPDPILRQRIPPLNAPKRKDGNRWDLLWPGNGTRDPMMGPADLFWHCHLPPDEPIPQSHAPPAGWAVGQPTHNTSSGTHKIREEARQPVSHPEPSSNRLSSITS
jgi:hypothetical protein